MKNKFVEGKIIKIISKLSAITGIVMLLFNYVYAPKKQDTQKENLQEYLYKQPEPKTVLKKWENSYKYEELSVSHNYEAKTLSFPITRVSMGGTMVVHIEPVMIEISPSDNLLASNIIFDIPNSDQVIKK